MNIGQVVNFVYTGNVQSYTIQDSGLYKLTVRGAEAGGSAQAYGKNGQGGVSEGYKVLKKGTVIYICCGSNVGYNGGGTYNDGSRIVYAGGATHIALVSGTLASIGKANFDKNGLIVAGGGGAEGYAYSNGGDGGGLQGQRGYDTTYGYGSVGGVGGSQTSGYAFGQGQNGYVFNDSSDKKRVAGAGGGGYYGGYAGGANELGFSGGGGGSGWIGGVPRITFKGTIYTPTTTQGGNTGNGTASIQYLAKGFPTIYLEDIPIEGAYLGNMELENILLGENELA